MGVTNLWQILDPVKQPINLSSLKGKTIAVDLSLWVCEAQTVKKMIGVVTKPHLRNLFFRVSSLTKMRIKLVFVMEGDAPKLKADTMSKRNELRYGPPKKSGAAKAGRSYFKSFLKECLEMLECLGVPWVQAAGEAEAMCAYLNANGYVDGCITNDGDVFLYGAQTVYRNFTMNAKDPYVDCYTMSSIKKKLGYDRESLIGLAVLLGCDYLPKGVPGVGKEQALKLLETLQGQSLLQRFNQWKEQFQCDDTPSLAVKKVTHCSVCRHPGSHKEHERSGCKLCGSVMYCEPHDVEFCCPCEWHHSEQEKKANMVEDNIKKKARSCEDFPFYEVIQEFLVNKNKLSKIMEWQRPNLLTFQTFAFEKMEWTRHYACKKLLALLTHYDMVKRKSGQTDLNQLQAIRIARTRIKNGIPCFEIEWQKPEYYVTEDDQPMESFVVTVEEESLFQAAYADVVAHYKMEKLEVLEKKQKSKKHKLKEKGLSTVDGEIIDLVSQMNLQSSKQDFKLDSKMLSDSYLQQKNTSRSEDLLLATKPSITNVQISKPASMLSPTSTSSCLHQSVLDDSLILLSPSSCVSSVIADLQLSGIDWEGTSFSTSPVYVDGTCSMTEIGASNNGISHLHSLQNKIVENTSKYSDSLQPDQDPCRSTDCLVSNCTDLVRHLQPLPLRERILLKTSVQSNTSFSQNIVQFKPLQQMKETLFSESDSSSPSDQLNNTSQETQIVFSEKQHGGSLSQNYQEWYRTPENLVQKYPNLSSLKSMDMKSHENKTSHFESKTLKISFTQTKPTNYSQVSKLCTQASRKAVKKSVCQVESSLSEDSDDGNTKVKKQISKKWRRQRKPVNLKENARDKQESASASSENSDRDSDLTTEWLKEETNLKITDNNLSTETSLKPELVTEDNSFQGPVQTFTRLGSCPLQQSKISNCDVWVDSPLPLSERLRLRFKNN
ncbi:flap endonuclease GEN homolog 1 [Alligator mississippiensis]|uniref:flap endonuclease GEN homolog 1 n=1 Tax=Alligator mississippiensis TaxID=8496 RepID=UPI0003D08931|nr:flap endonuclease GEN homolog 1 [Alligator mississippiensis]XP_059585445.1 flap endonuclease GEN homolog 1 [Alligator mississippiensis]XP_059585449.1 flap endonuclease GEN homolog 1 [Alligator mississippiensis]